MNANWTKLYFRQVALTDLLKALGIVPDGIIGHSVGELGCAYADGCMTAEQMVLSAYSRGRASLEVDLIKGMMAAVGKTIFLNSNPISLYPRKYHCFVLNGCGCYLVDIHCQTKINPFYLLFDSLKVFILDRRKNKKGLFWKIWIDGYEGHYSRNQEKYHVG